MGFSKLFAHAIIDGRAQYRANITKFFFLGKACYAETATEQPLEHGIMHSCVHVIMLVSYETLYTCSLEMMCTTAIQHATKRYS